MDRVHTSEEGRIGLRIWK